MQRDKIAPVNSDEIASANYKTDISDKTLLRKKILSLSIPVILEQLLIMMLGIANTIMVSRMGKEAIASVAMVELLSQFIIPFFSALSVGATVLVARLIGQGDVSKAHEAAKQALFTGILLALAVTGIIGIFHKQLLSILFGKAEAVVFENAVLYLRVTMFTYPFLFITLLVAGILRGAGDTKTPLKVTFSMNIINVLFSYILIYGFALVPSFGVKGAAASMSIARAAGAMISLYVITRGGKLIRLHLRERFHMDKELLYRMFQVGIPASLEQIFFTGGKLILQTFIVRMGTASIAADSIGMSVITLFYMPLNGFSLAATSLVGQCLGARDQEGAIRYTVEIVKIAMLSVCLTGILIFIFPGVLYGLYSSDREVIQLGTQLVRIFVLGLPFNILNAVTAGALRGAGDTRYCAFTTFIGVWATRLLLGYILGVQLHMGVHGFWIGMTLDLTIRGILYSVRFQRGKWKTIEV